MEEALREWLAGRARSHGMSVEEIPVGQGAAWYADSRGIQRTDGRFFRVPMIRVRTAGREVAEWTQPAIVEADAPGTLGTVVLVERGDTYLVRAISEPCNPGVEVDGVESYALFGPTIQYSGDNRLVHWQEVRLDAAKKPTPTPLIGFFENPAILPHITWQRAAGSGGRHRQTVQIGLLRIVKGGDLDAAFAQTLDRHAQRDDFRWVARDELKAIYAEGLANHHLRSVSSLLL